MKEDMIEFFTKHLDDFSIFCTNILEGIPVYWYDHRLTDVETKEVYAAMQEMFPGRNY